MSINQRFSILMKELNFYPSSLAKEIGVSQSSIKQVVDGENLPSAKVLVPLLEKFPLINMNWLLLGTGEMFLTENGNTEEKITQRDKVIKILEESVADLRRTVQMMDKRIEEKDAIISKYSEKEKMA